MSARLGNRTHDYKVVTFLLPTFLPIADDILLYSTQRKRAINYLLWLKSIFNERMKLPLKIVS